MLLPFRVCAGVAVMLSTRIEAMSSNGLVNVSRAA